MTIRTPLRSETLHGYTIEIHTDEYPMPYKDVGDHFGHIVYHPNAPYITGDTPMTGKESNALLFLKDGKPNRNLLVLPVYAYIHSGITIRTTPFADMWDSTRVGYVYCTHEEARKELRQQDDGAPLTEEEKTRAATMLNASVQEFDHYLRGEVYGFRILSEEGKDLDSCWGFVGELEYCLQEARSIVQHRVDNAPQLQLQLPQENTP